MVRVVAVNCLCDASVFNMAADFFINTKNIFFFEFHHKKTIMAIKLF